MGKKISGKKALALAGDYVNLTMNDLLLEVVQNPWQLLTDIKTLAGSVLSQGEKRSGTVSEIKQKRGNVAKAKVTKAKAPAPAATKKAAPKTKAKAAKKK